MKHYIVYSHGFGVDKTDRGLMTDIASAIPNAEHIMFDYNEIDSVHKTMTVSPLNEQVRRLQQVLDALEPDVVVDIVAHSQGCVVVALAKPKRVRRVVCITPPDSLSAERMVAVFGPRPGSHIDFNGESQVSRRDGTTTIIPQAYWQSIKLDVMGLYNKLPDLTASVRFYTAKDDEVLGESQFIGIDPRITITKLPGSHDFTGQDRTLLVDAVSTALS